jgi:pilus assembly protein CpaF
VNARDQIYIEKAGKPQLSPVIFSSEQQMMNVVERIVAPLGRRCDEKTPYVDARLTDGSRVHIIIPPLALRGPTITIRKFPKKRIGAKELIEWGSMTPEIADFLRMCVEGRLNIIVSGGTGSGKTTLLNTLSNFIPTSERIITVEDAAELQLGQDHVVRLETRPKNIEGEGEVSIRDLIKCCLRMRPDRVVVGECRGGEALDMLQAMNTGHDGSLTTLHANNPRDSVARLETLCMMSGTAIPLKAIREQIASAVHLIVQQTRLNDGSRKVTYITEVAGIQGDVISLQDIFIYKQEGIDKKRKIMGRFVPTGFIPKFVEDMEAKGLKVSRGLFSGGGSSPTPAAATPAPAAAAPAGGKK